MKKILLLMIPAFLLFSCSTENETTTNNNSEDFSQSQRDFLMNSNNNIGIYKGVFTTNDSEYRATVEIAITDITVQSLSLPFAQITTTDGLVYKTRSLQIAEEGVAISEMEFNSENLSFTFSVNPDGSNATVSNVLFKGKDAAIYVSKETISAPVTPITGTYVCTVCGVHPAFDNSNVQTWNVVIDENTGNITSQMAFGNTIVLNGIGVQDNCTPIDDFTNCDISSGDGSGNNVGFSYDGQPVTWTGTHNFNNEANNPTGDCSGMSGSWAFDTNNYGIIEGTFVSDFSCMDIIFGEDFQLFKGLGFAPGVVPSLGQLNSNIFIATGMNGVDLAYGDTSIAGDFARGESSGEVTTGGVYAFKTDATNVTWGVQPGGSDWTPGTFEIKVENTTGNTLNNFMISYDIYVNNNESRSNSFNFAYSTDGSSFIDVSALNYTSPAASDSDGFVKVSKSTSINVPVAAGGFIYLQFIGDDVSGANNRDEFGLDNVVVRAN